MRIGPFRIIRESEYQYLLECDDRISKVFRISRWFSGWEDLDIIWNYVFGKSTSSCMWDLRNRYAEARGTDMYGKTPAQNEEA